MGFKPGIFHSRGGCLTTRPTRWSRQEDIEADRNQEHEDPCLDKTTQVTDLVLTGDLNCGQVGDSHLAVSSCQTDLVLDVLVLVGGQQVPQRLIVDLHKGRGELVLWKTHTHKHIQKDIHTCTGACSEVLNMQEIYHGQMSISKHVLKMTRFRLHLLPLYFS